MTITAPQDQSTVERVQARDHHEYDYVIVGSGFGGSVSALRLAQKGYRVAVLEAGRRFADDEYAATTWQASKYYWMPTRDEGHLPAHPLQGRADRVGIRRRRRLARLREHAVPRPPALLRRPADP